MSRTLVQVCSLVVLFAFAVTVAHAQLPNPYGASIDSANAKKVAPAAVAEAKKNGWFMAVAVVDTAGNLVYFDATSRRIAPARWRPNPGCNGAAELLQEFRSR